MNTADKKVVFKDFFVAITISDKTKNMLWILGLYQIGKDAFIHMWIHVLHDSLHGKKQLGEFCNLGCVVVNIAELSIWIRNLCVCAFKSTLCKRYQVPTNYGDFCEYVASAKRELSFVNMFVLL